MAIDDEEAKHVRTAVLRESLRESESRFRAIFNHAAVGIAVADLSYRFVQANRKFTHIVGYEIDELCSKTFTDITHPDDVKATREEVRRLLAREIPEYIMEKRYVRKDGGIVWSLTTVTLLADAEGRPRQFIGIIEDITERKRTEAVLHENDRRKDEFLATLAHELRNPLAPIRQAALISKTPAASDVQKCWAHDVIDRQVQHMSLLLDDLLDVSRITRGTLELRTKPTELTAVIDAAVETARPAVDAKRQVLTVEVPKDPVYVAADTLRLAQVLSNLLTNAAKYTDPEGYLRVTVKRAQEHVAIMVADSGIGIGPDALPGIFQMFSQVKSSEDRSEGGLGIGLALAKGLIELHGGTIEARSAGLGLGSEFTVTLPLAQRPQPQIVESPAPAPKPAGAGRRILVADDNRDAADSLGILLTMDGHDVHIVHDGPAALAAFYSFEPEVALLDIGMPGLTGYEVARKLRQGRRSQEVLLIAVTGWGQEADKARAAEAGFDYHFTKPLDPQRLTDLLHARGS